MKPALSSGAWSNLLAGLPVKEIGWSPVGPFV